MIFIDSHGPIPLPITVITAVSIFPGLTWNRHSALLSTRWLTCEITCKIFTSTALKTNRHSTSPFQSWIEANLPRLLRWWRNWIRIDDVIKEIDIQIITLLSIWLYYFDNSFGISYWASKSDSPFKRIAYKNFVNLVIGDIDFLSSQKIVVIRDYNLMPTIWYRYRIISGRMIDFLCLLYFLALISSLRDAVTSHFGHLIKDSNPSSLEKTH